MAVWRRTPIMSLRPTRSASSQRRLYPLDGDLRAVRGLVGGYVAGDRGGERAGDGVVLADRAGERGLVGLEPPAAEAADALPERCDRIRRVEGRERRVAV